MLIIVSRTTLPCLGFMFQKNIDANTKRNSEKTRLLESSKIFWGKFLNQYRENYE